MVNTIIRKVQLFISLIVCIAFYGVIAKKSLKIDDYATCGKSPTCPIKIHNISLDYSSDNGFYLNIIGEATRDINSYALFLDIAITRCLNKEAPDTCEKVSNLKSPGVCRLLDLHGVGWDEIRDGFQPNLKCPFKKGIYVGKRLNLNPNMFKLFPLDGYYWKINGSLYEGKEYMASLCFALTIMNINN